MFNPRLRAASRMKWTKSSIDCYFLGCQCQKCEVYKIIGNKCRMKLTVLELVRRHGVPKEMSSGATPAHAIEGEEDGNETAYKSEETSSAEN